MFKNLHVKWKDTIALGQRFLRIRCLATTDGNRDRFELSITETHVKEPLSESVVTNCFVI